jgi:FkbM family methyltransferase
LVSRLHTSPSSINFHAVLGIWDLEGLETLEKVFRATGLLEGEPCLADIGANIGFISLWLSKLLSGRGALYAFERAPRTLSMNKTNIALNRVTNIVTVAKACSDSEREIDFFLAPHHHCSSLVESWASTKSKEAERIVMQATTIDAFFSGQGCWPKFIKMDIEGGGVFALRGCDQCIENTRPYFWIESHTPDEDRAISDLAIRHRYQAYRLEERGWVKHLKNTHPDREGVRGTLLLCPDELVEKVKPIL